MFRVKQIFNVGWQLSAWTANIIYRYQSGYFDANSVAGIPAPYNRNTVGAYGTFDLAVGWQGVKGLTILAGVLNVLDTEPSYTNQASRFQARAYDDRFVNPLGRTWTLGAKYAFE